MLSEEQPWHDIAEPFTAGTDTTLGQQSHPTINIRKTGRVDRQLHIIRSLNARSTAIRHT